MVYVRRYVSSQSRGFHLVLFQKIKGNEMKKMDERKKKLQKNEKMKMQIKKVRKKTKIKYRKIEKEKVKQKLNKTSKE